MFQELKELGQTENKKLINAYQRMADLIAALAKKEVPEAVVDEVNVKIANLNAYSGSEKEFARELERAYNYLLRLVQEVCNWVPRDFYRNQWMALGMSVFGIPLGIALGLALDNMAFMAAFLPLGMAMGMGVGSGMDKKAAEEGRVLDL
ncbi:MAG: hypothetical protein V2J07_00415 [Anaerolineae bacterium]|nr:hypothetical protein [Anaerolineae bacterium]